MNDIATQGFPPEAMEFLGRLRDNNNREWFESHKDEYKRTLLEPSRAFVRALGSRLVQKFPGISYSDKPNGGSLMRIYRDVRFSADKRPYKDRIPMMFVPAGEKKMAVPGFGLEISCESVRFMAGQFAFQPHQLKAFRQALDRPGLLSELEAVCAELQSHEGYTLAEPDLKNVPRGYDRDHPAAQFLRYKGFAAYAPGMGIDELCSPAAVGGCMERFVIMGDVWKWLNKILN